jgi:AP-3 complex subunit delta
MFEKSLVDLIRGLRNHKGSEATYIAAALRECRTEIRSQDLDLKATALLKLVYLEMFGYDMTWAAFNVLEVMSSAKPMQKRVGYLAAVQTFRPETEVLMLAENLLKKDLTSPSIPVLGLPLTTIPHIVTAELALSILTELMPRVSHSQPGVRKKTVVALYRLALVYPETLKVSWPKIKERLLDESEVSSVTAAAVNVVCELGWRNPRDFLGLAPRLFELLTGEKNNWMAIKIIKLFAVLTPLEPRLVKKLVRPLTKILKETGAMSLLYECINGIIQGGILDGADAGVDVDEVADLCISKLRGMIVLDGDPNLKYVALLAFNRIVGSHPRMVSEQQDVIMACLDDPDISIKMQALELVSGMVDADNLMAVVNRLMKQLANAPKVGTEMNGYEEPDTDLEQRLVQDKRSSGPTPIPDEYRHEIITRILDMCSASTYASITDFEWYIDILVHLVRHLPADATAGPEERVTQSSEKLSLGARIGTQLLDIAVRVRELRPEGTRAAETLLLVTNRSIVFASHQGGQSAVLKSAAWICGEFSMHLSSPHEVLNSLIHPTASNMPPDTLAVFCQTVPKIMSHVWTSAASDWSGSQSSTISLQLARTTTFLEGLSQHPNLEVQERAVALLELLKLASEALLAHPADASEAPLLLSSVIPALFSGAELNPVSATAQSKVPMPDDLDLDTPINPDLAAILSASQVSDDVGMERDAFDAFYHDREPDLPQPNIPQPQGSTRAISYRDTKPAEEEPLSYQSAPESPNTLARRRAERAARARDDPYYIGPTGSNGTSTPIHDALRQSNGDDLDIDSIPIIDLQLDPVSHQPIAKPTKKRPVRKFAIAADETLDGPELSSRSNSPHGSFSTTPRAQATRPTRGLLSIPSSQLGSVSLSDSASGTSLTAEDLLRREEEEKEMAAALAEVERKRMELQRAQERMGTTYAEGVDAEGGVVKRKKKKAKKVGGAEPGEVVEGDGGEGVAKRKKKKKARVGDAGDVGEPDVVVHDEGEDIVVKKKKKVKRRVGAAKEDDTAAPAESEAA